VFHSRQQWQLAWIGLAYLTTIGLVLYPALHEKFGLPLTLWNCIPPTLGLALIATTVGKCRRFLVVAATFAIFTAVGAIFFSAAWLFTPLDADPHSITTKLVFVFAPLFSLGIAFVGSALMWLVARAKLP
jgi:hypothetical protein